MTESRIRISLFLLFCLLYLYFFQGGGWNQNSHFDTVRAMIETGSPEIGAYAANTGDLRLAQGGVYSNKPPGLALLSAPVYFVLTFLQQRASMDTASPLTVTMNAHLIAFWSAGLPGALLVLLLHKYFRETGESPTTSGLLAAGFGTGTLVLPYAGIMMSHSAVACALFASWYLSTIGTATRSPAALSGFFLGAAVMIDYLAAPLAILLLVDYIRRNGRRHVVYWALGPVLAVLALLAYNKAIFGSFASGSYQSQNPIFVESGLFLGVFDWPDPRRIYWLTLDTHKGLFVLCPIFLLALGALGAGFFQLLRSLLAPAIIIGYFFLFNLCFNGWTGGWGVGPRYLIPALPFLTLFCRPAVRRHPGLSSGVIALSSLFMFSITSVNALMPSLNQGPPIALSPVAAALQLLAEGHVSISRQSIFEYQPAAGPLDRWDSYNLGELFGLTGPASLVPAIVLLIAIYALVVFSAKRRNRS